MVQPTAGIVENPRNYPLTLPADYPLTALPTDLLRNLTHNFLDKATVEVLRFTSRKLRELVSVLPRAKAEMCGTAAFLGYEKVLKWARQKGAPWKSPSNDPNKDEWNTCEKAIYGRHPELFFWSIAQKAPYKKSLCMLAAISVGNLDVMQSLGGEKKIHQGQDLFCLQAASSGQLEALKWLRNKKYPWSLEVCATAARGGHQELLNWAISNGAHVNSEISLAAAQGGQLALLQMIYTNAKHYWAGDIVEHGASQSSNVQMLEWLWTLPECTFNDKCLQQAVRVGNLPAVQFFRTKHIPWPETICSVAVISKQVKVLAWAMQNGAPFDLFTLWALNPLIMAQCLADKKELLTPNAYKLAVQKNVIPLLEFLRTLDLTWFPDLCKYATTVETLTWLLKNSAPYPKDIDVHFAVLNRYDLIRCLYQNGIPYNVEAICAAKGVNERQALEFFREMDRDLRGDS